MKSNTDSAKRNKRTGCTDMKAITDNAVQRSKQLVTLLLCAGLLFVNVPVHAGKVTRYVHTDHLGSPVAKTDSTGAVIWRQSYTPYGEDYQQADPDGPGFTGHRNDAASGLVYMQARYYDPEIGRFLSVDPVTFAPDQINHFNRYWYANGNPYRYVDPDGQEGVGVTLDANVKQLINGDITKEEYKELLHYRGMGGLAGAGIVTGGSALVLAGVRVLTAGVVGSEAAMMELGAYSSTLTLGTETAEAFDEYMKTGEVDFTTSDAIDVGFSVIPGGGEAGEVLGAIFSTSASVIEAVQDFQKPADDPEKIIQCTSSDM